MHAKHNCHHNVGHTIASGTDMATYVQTGPSVVVSGALPSARARISCRVTSCVLADEKVLGASTEKKTKENISSDQLSYITISKFLYSDVQYTTLDLFYRNFGGQASNITCVEA